MRVHYFGRLAEAAGVRSEEIAGPATVGALRAMLAGRVAGLGDAGKVRALVDDAFVGEDHRLDGAVEVAFLPPVSGG
jgi:molybdopterin converting factor small subunit